jgi:hypothetical protein
MNACTPLKHIAYIKQIKGLHLYKKSVDLYSNYT